MYDKKRGSKVKQEIQEIGSGAKVRPKREELLKDTLRKRVDAMVVCAYFIVPPEKFYRKLKLAGKREARIVFLQGQALEAARVVERAVRVERFVSKKIEGAPVKIICAAARS